MQPLFLQSSANQPEYVVRIQIVPGSSVGLLDVGTTRL